MKSCIACGMPMETANEHAGGDIEKSYCRFCCREDGSMQSYDEKLASMAQFIEKTRNVDAASAQKMAASTMEKLPAWTKKVI